MNGMAPSSSSSFDLPPEDYALTLLTHAAMQTDPTQNHISNNSNNSNNHHLNHDNHLNGNPHSIPSTSGNYTHISTSGYNHGSAPSSTSLTPDNSSTSISNQHSDLKFSGHRRQQLAVKGIPDILNGYSSTPAVSVSVPTSRSRTESANGNHNNRNNNMATLAFNPTLPASLNSASSHIDNVNNSRQRPYITPSFPGIGSQISQNYAQSLGILNAESFDDRPTQLRSRAELRDRPDPFLQLGMMPLSAVELDRTSSEDVEKGSSRRRKRGKEAGEEEDEEARKKARGRPRVDTTDETAADVSLFFIGFVLPLLLSVLIF